MCVALPHGINCTLHFANCTLSYPLRRLTPTILPEPRITA